LLRIAANMDINTIGQFKPNQAANPAIGIAGRLEYVEEDKVELIVDYSEDNVGLKKAIRELKKVSVCLYVTFWSTPPSQVFLTQLVYP